MGWNYTPSAAAASGILNLYPFAVQFWHALRERGVIAGGSAWAPQGHEYATGTITSAVDNGDGTVTLGDGTADWRDTAGNLRWTAATPGSNGVPVWSATSFDVVIDAPATPSISEPDPRLVLQVPIGTQPSASTVRCTLNVTDRVAERVLSGVSGLVGRTYWIVRRNGDNWTRGYPAPPNCGEYATGLVESSAAGTLTSATAIQNAAAIAAAGAADVVYVGASGHLQRGTLTGITGRALTFTGTSSPAVVGQRFYIVESGGVWKWGASGGFLQSFYGGRVDGYYGHDITDGLGVAGLPRHTYPVFYGTDPLTCPIDPEPVTIKDVDYYVPYDNVCAAGDIYLNPNVHKTLRGWWCEAMRLSAYYTAPVDHSGAASIPNFTAATWLQYAGVNGYTGTTGTHSGGSMPCSLGVPHAPVNLWWTILDDDGSPLLSGYEENYNGSTLTGTFGAAHDGKAVVGSVGPTRVCPRRLGRMFDVVYFLPDVDTGAILPPSNAHPGTWTIRPKSTHYSVPDSDGRVADSTLARHAAADGHYARYVGDNLADPGLAVLLSSDVDQPLKTYHNYAYVGTRSATHQNAINASLSGRATGGSTVRLVDASKDWLGVDFYPPTNGCTISGTATGGDTLTVVDSGKFLTALCSSPRFPGFVNPHVGFTMELLVSGSSFSDPAAAIEKRYIEDSDPDGGTWVVSEAFSVSPSGKQYRIVEPFVLNRWAGYKARLVRTDAGTVTNDVTVPILGNDGDTLYFASGVGFTIDDKTDYQILAPQFGAVYKRVSGEWVSTADMGDDPRNPGTNPFTSDARWNAEDTFTEYGLPRPNDVTFAFVTGWQELHDAINVLTDRIGPVPQWHAYANDAVPEYNTAGYNGEAASYSRGFLHSTYAHLETPVRTDANADYAATLPGTQDPAARPASLNEHYCDEEFDLSLGMRKSYAYLQAQTYPVPAFFPVGYSVTTYAYATVNGSLPGPDLGVTETAETFPDLRARSEINFDTSLGLLFRQWKQVGSGLSRVKVGGSLSTPPDWGTLINESDINSVDHEDGTLRSWDVITGAAVADQKAVYRMAFKFA